MNLLRRHGLMMGLGLLACWPQPFLDSIRSPNELVRIYLTRAIIDDGTVALDAQVKRFGRLIDRAERDGHTYCDKAPGMSFLGVPIYGAARLFAEPDEVSNRALIRWLRFLWLVLPTLLLAALMPKWMERHGIARSHARAAGAIYLLATPTFAYCLLWIGHQAAAWMVGLAILLADTSAPGDRWRRVLAGALVAMGGVTEYPTAPLVLVVGWLALRNAPRRGVAAGWFALGALGPVLLTAVYNHAAFGGPFTTGYSFITNPSFKGVHSEGLLGVGLPQLDAIVGLTVGSQRGLLVLAPWLGLALLGMWRLREPERKPLILALTIQVGLQFFIATGYGYWVGGWSVGPRHLVAALPAITVLALLGWERLRTLAIGDGLVRSFVLTSAGICTAIALTYPSYPEELVDPFVQITLPLLARLQGPDSLGTFVGLPASVALVLSLVIAAAISAWMALAGSAQPRWVLGAGIWITVGFVALLVAVRAPPTNEAVFRVAWLTQTMWQPKEGAEVFTDPRLARWESAVRAARAGRIRAADFAARGAVSSVRGEDFEALQAYALGAGRHHD